MNITLRPWRYAEDEFLPLTLRAADYLLVLVDLPADGDPDRRARTVRTMGYALRHRYILPTVRPEAACDLCTLLGPIALPAVWVGHPLNGLDAMRVATLLDARDAWSRVVLSPRRSEAVLAAARAVGAVVLEAQR